MQHCPQKLSQRATRSTPLLVQELPGLSAWAYWKCISFWGALFIPSQFEGSKTVFIHTREEANMFDPLQHSKYVRGATTQFFSSERSRQSYFLSHRKYAGQHEGNPDSTSSGSSWTKFQGLLEIHTLWGLSLFPHSFRAVKRISFTPVRRRVCLTHRSIRNTWGEAQYNSSHQRGPGSRTSRHTWSLLGSKRVIRTRKPALRGGNLVWWWAVGIRINSQPINKQTRILKGPGDLKQIGTQESISVYVEDRGGNQILGGHMGKISLICLEG